MLVYFWGYLSDDTSLTILNFEHSLESKTLETCILSQNF